MAPKVRIIDRWHKRLPKDDEPVCKEHRKAGVRLVPSAEHGKGARYQVRWTDTDGEPQKKNFDTLGPAEIWEAKIKNDLVEGTYIDPRKGNILFRDFSEEWAASQTVSFNVRTAITQQLRDHINPVIGSYSLADLARTPSLIQGWLATLENSSPYSVRQYFRHVNAIFNSAIADGRISRNPCQAPNVSKPRLPDTKAKPLTENELAALAEALGDYYGSMVPIGSGVGGMRQGEIFALSPDDINWPRGDEIHIQRQLKLVGTQPVFALPKHNKTRIAPLPESIKLIISEHIRKYPPTTVTLPWNTPDGEPTSVRLLFVYRNGNWIHRNTFDKTIWKRALREAGLPTTREYGMHVLRHTYASLLLSRGVDVRSLAEWLGHSTAAITLNTYAHFIPSNSDRAREVVDSIINAIRTSQDKTDIAT